MKFPYEYFPSGSGSVPFPTINIILINPKTKKNFSSYKVLVDSGAAGCVFHAGIGEAVGIDIKSGKKLPLTGATGQKEEQFIHSVIVIVGGHSIELEAGFSYNLHFPFGLLGQKGFFEKLRVCFDLPKREFEIVPKSSK